MLEIKKVSFEEISNLKEFKLLTEEYAEEGKIEGLPSGKVDYDTYRRYENAGILTIFGAFYSGKLVGFIFLLTTVMPHRTIKVVIEESIFVSKEYRNTGAGTRLIKVAEQLTEDTDSICNIFTAPANGILDKVLSRKGYKKIQHIFLKAHE